MHIQVATLNHIEEMSHIHAFSWKFAYKGIVPQKFLDELQLDFWVPTFEIWMRNDIVKGKVLYNDEKMIGCIVFGKSREESLPNWGEIISCYLLPEYFHKGYGKFLIKSALSDLEELEYENVYLWVLQENQRARNFYEKIGFQNMNKKCTCDIMDKKLTDICYGYSIKNLKK